MSPYTLVYGKEAILPPNILFPSSRLAQDSRGIDNEVLQIWIQNMLKLEESRSKSRERFKHQQEMVSQTQSREKGIRGR